MGSAAQKLISSSNTSYTQEENIKCIFEKQKIYALELRKSTAAQRIAKLKKLRNAILTYRKAIYKACYDDFRKPEIEVDLTEILPTLSEANHAIKRLKHWMKPVRVLPTKTTFGTRSYIRHEPMGVTLIIAPWNYPVNLTLSPLISSIAAGNTTILKPSEITPNTTALLHELVKELFDEKEVALFEGDDEVAQQLLKLPFNHIFFTGSTKVGKIVMTAAAKHLSKVTLELGGKSPAIIDKNANIKNAAKSVALTKYANNGQTCIAPDYVYVHEEIKNEFIAELKRAINHAFGDTLDAQLASSDYARIVNNHHYNRIKALLDDALARGARIEIGGHVNKGDDENFISPTVLSNVDESGRIMKEEIFGPLLPVFAYSNIEAVIDYINTHEKPLALYIYTEDQAIAQHILVNTSSGDACINTALLQYLHHKLPFGGVNYSGIGKAHGIHGFHAFSHKRSVVNNLYAPTLIMAPPYNFLVKWLAKFVVRYLS